MSTPSSPPMLQAFLPIPNCAPSPLPAARLHSKSTASSAMAPAQLGLPAIRTSTMTTGYGAATSMLCTPPCSTASATRGDAANADSAMPAFGDILKPEEIDAVAHLYRVACPAAKRMQPKSQPAKSCSPHNCVACHGEDGKGRPRFRRPEPDRCDLRFTVPMSQPSTRRSWIQNTASCPRGRPALAIPRSSSLPFMCIHLAAANRPSDAA